MRAIFEGPEDREAMAEGAAAVGMVLVWEKEEPESVEVWPDHMQSAEVFASMSDQLIVGPTGKVMGHRKEALPAVMDMLGVAAHERRQVFVDFNVMAAEHRRLLRGLHG